jgi:hypothetical protein
MAVRNVDSCWRIPIRASPKGRLVAAGDTWDIRAGVATFWSLLALSSIGEVDWSSRRPLLPEASLLRAMEGLGFCCDGTGGPSQTRARERPASRPLLGTSSVPRCFVSLADVLFHIAEPCGFPCTLCLGKLGEVPAPWSPSCCGLRSPDQWVAEGAMRRAAPLPATCSLQPTLTRFEAGICFANELLVAIFFSPGFCKRRIQTSGASSFLRFLFFVYQVYN